MLLPGSLLRLILFEHGTIAEAGGVWMFSMIAVVSSCVCPSLKMNRTSKMADSVNHVK